MNLFSKTNKIELHLKPHQLLSLDNKQNQTVIECKQGDVWVTCSGDAQDYLLRAGKQFTSKSKGNLLIEAITKKDACVDIEEQ
jgi:ferric-dicitrate binding protein FerR (iron transport regulator)